jgi:hypothetical protein
MKWKRKRKREKKKKKTKERSCLFNQSRDWIQLGNAEQREGREMPPRANQISLADPIIKYKDR